MKRLLAAFLGLCLIATCANSFWQSRLQVSVGSTPFVGPLDGLAVKPTCAESTRRLFSAYLGNALNVRNSSGGAQDIGFTAAGDLDTTALAAFIGANSGFIVTKYNQGSGTCDATQATAGNQPRIVNAGTNDTLNGHASDLFGVSAATCLQFTNTTAQPTSIGFVSKLNAQVVNGHYTDGFNSSPRNLIGNAAITTYSIYAGGTPQTGGVVDTVTHSIFGVFNGATSNLFVDATNPVSNQNPGTNGMGLQVIGAGNGTGGACGSINGFLPEYLVWNSVVSVGDRAIVRASWQSYWGAP